MNRRRFLASSLLPALPAVAADLPVRRLALSFDDVSWRTFPKEWWPLAGTQLLRALPRQAGLFVCGRNVDDPTGLRILREWSDAGHTLGNHTWFHQNYGNPAVDAADFQSDILRNERLLFNFPGFRRLFRFPVLKEGHTAQRRDSMRDWLREHGYRHGHVTIDASDWYYDARLRQRLERDPDFNVQLFRNPYLAHLVSRTEYYDALSRRLLGRSIPHTILLHYNLINALFIGDAIALLRDRGWRIVDLREAYFDNVYRTLPRTVPAGESLLWAMAKETGRFDRELRYPAEDDVYEKPILDRLRL